MLILWLTSRCRNKIWHNIAIRTHCCNMWLFQIDITLISHSLNCHKHTRGCIRNTYIPAEYAVIIASLGNINQIRLIRCSRGDMRRYAVFLFPSFQTNTQISVWQNSKPFRADTDAIAPLLSIKKHFIQALTRRPE